jgi:Zn-dependent protease
MAVVLGLMFISILLHEFGHCFAARRMDGEADEVVLWPLGGLARCDVPHTPWANFVTAAGGPLVNVLLFVLAGLALAFLMDPGYRPPWNPFEVPYRKNALGWIGLVPLNGILPDGLNPPAEPWPALLLARLFWVNWILFLFNICLVGFPFDSGRMLQCALWPYFGYKQAMLYAIFAGFGVMIILLVVAFAVENNAVLLLLLAWFCYSACKQEWIILESGGEDSVFGYDFSQGYTSLEREEEPTQAPPKRKKQNFLQRWLQRRAARKMQEQQQRQAEDDRRMDELLEKIQRHGKESLTDEEQRFLKRVSDRYRNKPT